MVQHPDLMMMLLLLPLLWDLLVLLQLLLVQLLRDRVRAMVS